MCTDRCTDTCADMYTEMSTKCLQTHVQTYAQPGAQACMRTCRPFFFDISLSGKKLECRGKKSSPQNASLAGHLSEGDHGTARAMADQKSPPGPNSYRGNTASFPQASRAHTAGMGALHWPVQGVHRHGRMHCGLLGLLQLRLLCVLHTSEPTRHSRATDPPPQHCRPGLVLCGEPAAKPPFVP